MGAPGLARGGSGASARTSRESGGDKNWQRPQLIRKDRPQSNGRHGIRACRGGSGPVGEGTAAATSFATNFSKKKRWGRKDLWRRQRTGCARRRPHRGRTDFRQRQVRGKEEEAVWVWGGGAARVAPLGRCRVLKKLAVRLPLHIHDINNTTTTHKFQHLQVSNKVD
jgi:hypothetical protein